MIVHGDIRHLEMLSGALAGDDNVHGDIRHLENRDIAWIG